MVRPQGSVHLSPVSGAPGATSQACRGGVPGRQQRRGRRVGVPSAALGLRARVRSAELPHVERVDFVQGEYRATAEYDGVVRIADRLLDHLQEAIVVEAILEANQPGRSSGAVQAVFLEQARELGFKNESKGLFKEYASALRPDYFMPLDSTGIILEVERGKTTINNMDLLDFWKCHICASADYLFLLVPRELRQNETMSPRREFATVAKRLATFFEPGNYTNVRGLCLFGY